MTKLWRRTATTVLAFLFLVAGVALCFYRQPLWFLDQRVRVHLWRSDVKSKYVDVDGYKIHYLEAMPRSGEDGMPLILIHGLGARGEDWSPLIPGLSAAGFHVYVPDLLGYGRSAHPDVSYSIRMQGALVADFAHAVHVEKADVAGWSMGGWVAMRLAVDHPKMVNRLVLFDAAGTYFPGYTDLQSVFDAKDVPGVNRLFGMLTPHPKPIPRFVAEALVRKLQGNVWVVKRSLAAMTSGRDLMDFRLYAIPQPTLIVWGKQDELIPLEAGEKIHQGIAGSSMLVVDGTGHLTPAECSRTSLEAMVTYLQARSTPKAEMRTVTCDP